MSSLLGKMATEGEIISGWGKREGDFMEGHSFKVFKDPVEQRKQSLSRKKKFIKEQKYEPGDRIEDKNTGVKGIIKSITAKGEIIIHSGTQKFKLNPLHTQRI